MPESLSNYPHRIRRLVEVCRSLSGHPDLEPLLHAIIESSSELTGSENSSILVPDEEKHALRFLVAPWYILDKMKSLSVSIENSVAGWVYTHNQPFMLHQAENDERIHRVTDHELGFVTYSILAVPLSFKGKVIGVLEAVNKDSRARYNEEDIMILETLAAQAAVAIENRRLLDEVQQAYHKVVELDRMKSDFIAIASHELRTPLGVILGHATFLQETVAEDQREELEIIVRSAMRLKEIIEDFSNINHFEHGLSRLRRGQVIVQQVIQEVTDGFRDLALDHQVSISLSLPQKHVVIEGDERKIAVALREVVKNGVVFSNPGGQVRVKFELIPGYVKISVSDNGIGIPLEEQTKIFQRFYQVEKHLTRRHGGMGLGLSIAKDMIEMHGGKIWVESVEGKGSRFTIQLPMILAPINSTEVVFQ